MPQSTGLLLAAGAGRRMGGPKALVVGEDGRPWAVSAIATLRSGGCDEITVVVGADARTVRERLDGLEVMVVEAVDWADGLGASLKAGLDAISDQRAESALVHLVDLPDVGPAVVERVLAKAGPGRLVRATYDGRPGHPVLIGRRHWRALSDELTGDTGARRYLSSRSVIEVECGDLASGRDVDYVDMGSDS